MKRIAIVKKERCKAPHDCPYLCMKACPINRAGKECIKIGEDKKPVIVEELCIGCNICVVKCPFNAISIINLPEELSKEPVHRFGSNGFQLFSLPTPLFGQVVGIIGRNGIGKTTAVKILAGLLEPNLGKDTSDYDALLQYFKGTEAQSYFQRLKNKDIKASYKPQTVDSIPKMYTGMVIDLLKKVDEKGKAEEFAHALGIDSVLHSDINAVSGGELQRIAIAAAALKKADLYVFDEPSSYLDTKQRLIVARFIRSMLDEKTAIIVIEHDLILLDYIADALQIMFGEEAAYGIVSQIRPVRNGINIYLSGFLKEENIRFRDKHIQFVEKPPTKMVAAKPLMTYSDIKIDLGRFKLAAEDGKLYQHSVTGVLGENGTGKTTFVKALAGAQAFEGTLSKKLKVSYKPQYLKTESDEIVSIFLKQAIQFHNADIIRPLGLMDLFPRRLSELSGGELQRVVIAYNLSQDVDLYLLDEPSAYLDVEQRLIVAKMLRDFALEKEKTLLVVDHDLVFMDYLADDMLVFQGTPAVSGVAKGPFSMEQGMNTFLSSLGITLRRDPDSKRPRINKEGSQLDKEQKSTGKYYYA